MPLCVELTRTLCNELPNETGLWVEMFLSKYLLWLSVLKSIYTGAIFCSFLSIFLICFFSLIFFTVCIIFRRESSILLFFKCPKPFLFVTSQSFSFLSCLFPFVLSLFFFNAFYWHFCLFSFLHLTLFFFIFFSFSLYLFISLFRFLPLLIPAYLLAVWGTREWLSNHTRKHKNFKDLKERNDFALHRIEVLHFLCRFHFNYHSHRSG